MSETEIQLEIGEWFFMDSFWNPVIASVMYLGVLETLRKFDLDWQFGQPLLTLYYSIVALLNWHLTIFVSYLFISKRLS